MKIYEIIILIILGIFVLFCYFKYLKSENKVKTNYFNNEFWYGINPSIVKLLTIFQILAVAGFLISIISWIKNPPKGGIMDKYLFLTLVVFLLSAALWPYAVHKKIVWLVVLVLIITAISSILLLAGSIEEQTQRLQIVIGLLFLCITTVLGDAVLWNANYIKKNIKS